MEVVLEFKCLSQDSISPENEYRSSSNIAISLFRRYRNFVERGGIDNLKEFISTVVNAYALGCTVGGLTKEIIDMMESGVEIEAMEAYGGSSGLKSKIFSREVSPEKLPVRTLQSEQMAVMGRAEEPSLVSSRMRLLFSTVEVVSPQWPRV